MFPLASMSKKQSSVTTSTTEEELIALYFMVKTELIPAMYIWDTLFQRQVKLHVFEDNQSVLYIVTTGKNQTMRHMERVHRVSMAWLYEIYDRFENVSWHYATSKEMVADLYTKQFADVFRFEQLRTAIGIADKVDDVIAMARELQDSRNEEKFVGATPPKVQIVQEGGPSSCEEQGESIVSESANVEVCEPYPQVNSDDTIFHSDHVRSAGGESIVHPPLKPKNVEGYSSSGDESIESVYTDGTKLSRLAPKKRQENIGNVL